MSPSTEPGLRLPFIGGTMNVTPLDLQVLFSKANDHSITQSKEAARIDSINVIANSQMTKESKEAPEVVRNIRENDEQFTKIDPDNASPSGTAPFQEARWTAGGNDSGN